MISVKYNKPKIISKNWGQPHGRVVNFTRSAAVAQGFAGSDPGRGHGTAYQATLRRCPTCHNYEDPQLKTYNYVLGGLGEKKQGEKKGLATVVSSGANLRKNKIN